MLVAAGDDALQEIPRRSLAALKVTKGLELLDHSFDTVSLDGLNLDTVLQGGIPSRSITEIVGEESSGKSQICYQLMLSAIKTHHCTCLYIDTQLNGAKRLSQIFNNHGSPELLNRVFIQTILEFDELSDYLSRALAGINGMAFKMIVIDSMAAVLDAEKFTPAISIAVQRIYGLLRSYAHDANAWIISINQLVENADYSFEISQHPALNANSWMSTDANGQSVRPSFGLAWTSNIKTIFRLQKHNNGTRTLQCLRSNQRKNSQARFIITDRGLEGAD